MNIWIGDGRSVSSVHKDPFENFTACEDQKSCPPASYRRPYLGEKKFRQATYHQPKPGDPFEIRLDDTDSLVPWCEVDPLHPDLEKFPEFAHASPVSVDVHAGDMLYIPSLWYHRVSHNHASPSIAVNYWYAMEFGPSYVAMMLRREVAGMELI